METLDLWKETAVLVQFVVDLLNCEWNVAKTYFFGRKRQQLLCPAQVRRQRGVETTELRQHTKMWRYLFVTAGTN